MLSLLYYLFENYLVFSEQVIVSQHSMLQTDDTAHVPQSHYQPSREPTVVSNLALLRHVLKCFDQFLSPASDKISYESTRFLSSREEARLSSEAKRLLQVAVNAGLLNSHHLERTLALSSRINVSIISSEQLSTLMSLSVMNPPLSVDELAQLCDSTIINSETKEVVH